MNDLILVLILAFQSKYKNTKNILIDIFLFNIFVLIFYTINIY